MYNIHIYTLISRLFFGTKKLIANNQGTKRAYLDSDYKSLDPRFLDRILNFELIPGHSERKSGPEP